MFILRCKGCKHRLRRQALDSLTFLCLCHPARATTAEVAVKAVTPSYSQSSTKKQRFNIYAQAPSAKGSCCEINNYITFKHYPHLSINNNYAQHIAIQIHVNNKTGKKISTPEPPYRTSEQLPLTIIKHRYTLVAGKYCKKSLKIHKIPPKLIINQKK